MKVCVYCDRNVADDVMECPSCSSTAFVKLCPGCGRRYDGFECPHCKEARDASARAAAELQSEEAARQRANSHLGLKALLAFIMPYIGGYFLINKRVNRGYRIFAIVWCLFFTLYMLTYEAETYLKVELFVLTLAPVAVYLIREKAWRWRESDLELKVVAVAFLLVLLLAIVNALV